MHRYEGLTFPGESLREIKSKHCQQSADGASVCTSLMPTYLRIIDVDRRIRPPEHVHPEPDVLRALHRRRHESCDVVNRLRLDHLKLNSPSNNKLPKMPSRSNQGLEEENRGIGAPFSKFTYCFQSEISTQAPCFLELSRAEIELFGLRSARTHCEKYPCYGRSFAGVFIQSPGETSVRDVPFCDKQRSCRADRPSRAKDERTCPCRGSDESSSRAYRKCWTLWRRSWHLARGVAGRPEF